MAKRHHGGPKGHNKMGEGHYVGPLQRRALEREDAGMISEDRNAMANLPQDVKMMYYSKNRYSTYDLDDTIRGIDEQVSKDGRSDIRRDGFKDGHQ